MNRRTAIAVAALSLLFAPVLIAVDISTLKPQGYVSDFASVIDAQSKAELEAYSGSVEKSTGVQMAFVTLDSLDGESLEDFTNDLYRRWGVGQKGKDEGLMVLLVIRDRRSRLEVGRGLEEFIPDGVAGSLLRQMRPYLQQQHYGNALLVAARSLGGRISQAKGVQIAEEMPARRRPPPTPAENHIPWPVILGGLVFLFWMMSMGSRRGGGGGFLPGLILGSMLGRSSHGGYSRGGFGGYDSGGGFGGFGGGDSGGGGASGDW